MTVDERRLPGRYVRIEDLPALLRSYGLVPTPDGPAKPAATTVSARAARGVLAALAGRPAPLDDDDTDVDEVVEVPEALESDEDTELDDDSFALYHALEELSSFIAARAWSAALHPKWPKGHEQGGKFRPNIDRIIEKVTDWQKGDRKGDPFEGFGREQLRKVAVKRGIKLPRGADREVIAKHLLDDLESKEVKPKPDGVTPRARKTMLQLAGGTKTRITSDQVEGLMAAIQEIQPPPFNLAKLQVLGSGNSNLFQRHLRDRPRETMPQLPTGFGQDGNTSTGRTMEDFEQFLHDKGVKFEYGTMDPRELVASQSELSGPKVAKLYGFMRKGGWKEGGVMIVARHGDEWVVVDGHHRWAGAAAASIVRGAPLDVTVMYMDADVDDVLGTPENPEGIVMDFASFEGLATDRGV